MIMRIIVRIHSESYERCKSLNVNFNTQVFSKVESSIYALMLIDFLE